MLYKMAVRVENCIIAIRVDFGGSMKLNCWQFNKCGREPGGLRVSEFGVCEAATERKCDGIHGGRTAGRSCWAVAGTLCGGQVQGSFAQKITHCLACEFYKRVREEEGENFMAVGEIIAKLVSS